MSSSLNIEEVQPSDEQSEAETEVPLTKEKKPRTQKQIEALQKGRAKIQENALKRKHEKKIEASKLLLANDIPLPEAKPHAKKKAAVQEEEDDSDADEQVVYIKKKKSPPKKKKKKIIVYQDSSSESEEEEEEEEEEVIHQKKHFKSQQNKKSIVKVYDTNPPKPRASYTNFFCD